MEMKRLLTDLGVTHLIETGTNIQANCPFHGETRPSWGIMKYYPYVYHCFTCGVSGTVIKLIEHQKDCNPIEAYRIAEKYGYIESDKMKEGAYTVPTMTEIELERYTLFYNKKMLKRGLSKRVLKEWEVGYDIENNRHTFAIRDENSKLIGMASRRVKGFGTKYMFHKGTQKGSVLYGLFKCHYGTAIIVEGFVDALKLWELGVRNVVALMGNQASKKQIELITRNFNKVYIALDNDEEGKFGARKLIWQLKGRVKLFILEYPKYIKDAGEFTRRAQVRRWLKGRKVVLV